MNCRSEGPGLFHLDRMDIEIQESISAPVVLALPQHGVVSEDRGRTPEGCVGSLPSVWPACTYPGVPQLILLPVLVYADVSPGAT